MTNVKTTKKALLSSAVALLLCFAMLLGTTFAWFTDSASSGSNVITSGNLDIVVEYTLDGTTWNKLDGAKDLFQKGLWEPGHTEVVAVRVTNNGNLALKYSANMNVTKEYVGKTKDGADIKLSEILMVSTAVTDASAVAAAFASDSAIAGATATPFKSANVLANDETLLQQGEVDYIIIKVDMAETVGNEANHNGIDVPAIEFGLNFFATQYTKEIDSFGDQYDVDSKYPVVGTASVPANTIEATLIQAGDVSVYIPAMANEGEYKLEVANKSVETTADGTVASYDIDLTCNGEAVSGVTYPVTIAIGTFLDVKSLTHNGNAIANYEYDASTGLLSFMTTAFTTFEVTYVSALSDDAVVEDGKIVAGTFDINPATLDASLAEEGSEYIAIDYTVGGATKYVVAKRSTTVVLSPEAEVTTVNGNYTVKTNASGKLYSEISALKNNEHSTVYLLPGTYNEASTIYIYSSMDIIGLGDKDSVKVVKASSSDSNRHLFNASGTKADYIQVTLRNMYLDATVNTTNGKDNAAVQSIRKSKVKCYDLTIVKGTDWNAVAFYVNGNNAVDGVKYPAYMYVENCALNTTRSFGVISTAGTYKFYHTGLTYGGTAYTNNSGSIKNQAMAPDVWDW